VRGYNVRQNGDQILQDGLQSIDPIVVSVIVFEIFDIKAIFIGAMVKINSTSGLADMRLSDFHPKQ